LNLTIIAPTTSNTVVSNCVDYTWAANGTTYTSGGIYTETLVNSQGCDSIATLDLSILNPSASTLSVTECDTYTWAANGNTYTSTGMYSVNLLNSQGCDSTANLDLTITQSSAGTDVASNCVSYTWPANGNTYTSTGMYATTLTNSQGCDSTVTLDLTINNPYNLVQNVGSCTDYTWPANGQTYIATGVHVANLTSVSGCDSTITLNLTISSSSFSEEIVSSCSTFFWPTTNTTYTSTGLYSTTLMGGSGCDSVVTLNLTITNPTTSTSTISNCDDYTWAANGVTYNSTGIYTTVLINSNGCDSTATLDLTILAATPTNTSTVVECDSYTWAANGNTYTGSGLFSESYTNMNGCDSIVELDLTINSSSTSLDNITACSNYVWGANGMTYTSSGQYNTVLTNAEGCDSTLTLSLVIDNADASASIVDDLTMTADLTGATYAWIDCNNGNSLIAGATNQTYTATANGDYAVIVTENGCSDTSACMNISSVGIEDIDFNTEIKVYPNPTSGQVTIDLGTDYSNVEIRVTNALGQIIDMKKMASASIVDMNLDGARGTYILEITTEEGEIARVRVVKD